MTLEELQAINFHWRLAIDQIREGVLILQGSVEDFSSLSIVYANRAMIRQTGWKIEDVIDRPLINFMVSADQRRLQADWVARGFGAESILGVYGLKSNRGYPAFAQWTVSSRADQPDQVADHTLTLQWKEAGMISGLADQNAFEVSKADTISQIAKGVVHDFNNSLMAIRGHLEVVLAEQEESSTSAVAINQAMAAVDTTGEICRRLLNYAKGQKATKCACAVSDLVNQAVAITGLGSNVTCRRMIPDDLWPIFVDGIQIVQVINNLLMNAQQAMPTGGVIAIVAENVPVGVQSTIGLPPGNYVALTVRDRGIGIPEEYRGQIFESLFTTKAEGSGLGLATCARIVSNHSGFIDVRSIPNKGSEFIVYLPAALETDEPQTEVSDRPVDVVQVVEEIIPSRAPVDEGRWKILVVEDQVGIAEITRTYLVKQGHQVHWVPDGQQAIRSYRQAWHQGEGFDLVILDMTLPGGMNGEDTFRELREFDSQVVGIATSGSFDRQGLPELQKKGFAGILPKPYPLKMLGEVVQDAMAQCSV